MKAHDLKFEARLSALEWMTCAAMATMIDQSLPDPASVVAEVVKGLADAAGQATFPELADPAMSDLMAAELETAFARLGKKLELLVAGLGKQRRGSQRDRAGDQA